MTVEIPKSDLPVWSERQKKGEIHIVVMDWLGIGYRLHYTEEKNFVSRVQQDSLTAEQRLPESQGSEQNPKAAVATPQAVPDNLRTANVPLCPACLIKHPPETDCDLKGLEKRFRDLADMARAMRPGSRPSPSGFAWWAG